MARWSVFPDDVEPPRPRPSSPRRSSATAARLAVYREPVGDHWQIFCLLPRPGSRPARTSAISPHPREAPDECVKKIDRFVDPIVVMSPEPGLYWTPNGNHRRSVLDKLKAEVVPAIVVADPEWPSRSSR